jgi:hypothetical protein
MTDHSVDINKMVDNDIREVAKQAAREAVAQGYDHQATRDPEHRERWLDTAACIRSGEWDANSDVSTAILGALAALDAVAPLIVGRCAETARGDQNADLRDDDRVRFWVSGRKDAADAILALAPKEGETT